MQHTPDPSSATFHPALSPTVPHTITTTDGRVWTYVPGPFEGEFAREYRSGPRKATRMTYRNSSRVVFVTPSGKRLEVAA